MKRTKKLNAHDKELMRKYGTVDRKKIFALIDKRESYGPFRLSEIGMHDDNGAPALSHVEDAAFDDMYSEDGD